ncbi:Sec-independent protein translocase protein TatA [Sulfurovum sp. enrichment culture clone C5]|uniref:Sec-independent protein translocase protein TatA n=1 Tax=Sulfurovum sp. enrichment culture clone C5 TaxID=497650 RepID=A0A0S4XPX1_9BACT|nr:Sec-independent protein translocase protein TatA [Sulfurovum sp. enrichment culture clone C5]
MGSFSMGHWLIVLAVIVLLFGAKKIPELAKGLGKGIKDFKEAVKEEETDDTKELTSAEDSETKSTKSTKTTKKS